MQYGNDGSFSRTVGARRMTGGAGPYSMGAEPEHHAELVFFRPEALSEYRGRVEDWGKGIRRVKRYGFKVYHAEGSDHIDVMMGDLAGLPVAEQLRWKKYQVMSATRAQSDIKPPSGRDAC